VTGWTKAGFVARDDLTNERKSIVVGEFQGALFSVPFVNDITIHIAHALLPPGDLARAANPNGVILTPFAPITRCFVVTSESLFSLSFY
jgi:hypothetical protein